MNSLLKENDYDYYFIFFLFFIVWSIESFVCIRVADDVSNLNIQYFERCFWALKLGGWSSRFIIDPVAFFLISKLPYVVWKVFNSVLMTMQIIFLNKIFNKERENFYLFVIGCCTFLFPYSQEYCAGWCFTTVTYYWTLISAVISFYYVKEIYENNKLSFFQNFVLFIATLYACDSELSCLFCLISVLFVFISNYIEKRNVNSKLLVILIVCFLRFSLHVFWQMNMTRNIQEIVVHYPDFLMLSFVDKLQNGFSTCCHLIFIDFPQLALLLSVVLATHVFISKKANKSKVISLLAPFFLFSYVFSHHFYTFDFFKKIDVDYSPVYGLINFSNFSELKSYIELIVFFVILGSLAFSIFSIPRNISISLSHFGILLGGFFSRMAMGFSPTIYASGLRTFSFVQGALMICLVAELSSLKKSNKQYSMACSYICILFGIVSILRIILDSYGVGR